MAIIRCPYCHAITDENDKYCNNCGTQLLFPDDEAIEEEIPGEKLIDAETEEKDYEIDEPGKPSESRTDDEEEAGDEVRDEGPRGEDEKGDKTLGSLIEDEEAAEELEEFAGAEDTEEARGAAAEKAEAEDTAGEEEEPEEVVLVDEIAAREAGEEESREVPIPPPMRAEEEDGERDTTAVVEEEGLGVPPGTAAPPVTVFPPTPEPAREPRAEPYEAAVPTPALESEPAVPKPVTFDTRELEGIGQTVDLSKARLDKFIDDKAAKEKPPEKPAEAPKPKEPTGTLPPWAHRMKGEASKLGDEESDEASPFESAKRSLLEEDAAGAEAEGCETRGGRPDTKDEEVEIFPHRKKSDSGLGYPERLTQALLPFESAETREESEVTESGSEEEEESETAAGMPGEAEEEEEDLGLPARPAPAMPPPAVASRAAAAKPTAWEPRPAEEEARRAEGRADILEEEYARPPFSFSVFAKSKAFDIFFTGFFWLVAVWIAAHSTGTTLFGLLGASGGALFLFYLVLVFLYFFLFKFFLGETIGDRLFRERPEREPD